MVEGILHQSNGALYSSIIYCGKFNNSLRLFKLVVNSEITTDSNGNEKANSNAYVSILTTSGEWATFLNKNELGSLLAQVTYPKASQQAINTANLTTMFNTLKEFLDKTNIQETDKTN